MMQTASNETQGTASGGRALVVDAVTHRYGSSTAVENINLDIRAGELVALLGPSGCGKTTLLRIIAGFIRQTEGRIILGDEVVDDLGPNRRRIGIVFQNYALFPHLSIAENVAYGPAAQGIGKAEREAETKRLLELVKLGHLADRLPRQLSGGQQQRVALARALAIKPRILLLDEPFAALDKNLRLDMQIEIKRLQRLSGITTVMVTHDQEEALSMADRVAVLSQGRLEQFAAPTQIYDRPDSLFVNTFVGTANQLSGQVLASDGDMATIRLDAGAELRARSPGGVLASGQRCTVCLRPEHLEMTDDPAGFAAVVEMGLPLGATVVHEVRGADGAGIKVSEPRRAGTALRATGTPVRVRPLSPDLATAYPA
ncbi:ABC transporter ATP-binding protein [Azorhizobium oxalatiphilum]|uniref:ABC transporter ATP-binding protein n=1 Tax=Azorhizobium oxalatiphilum TaxID=980631 RepID=A0A917FEI7_9HYPH|nr:ABC transporter ATP-binding protein [Azorhizobium oxalatiphilum]GGF70189.1 ABC transporter ATP-binding protein [Azorhizobium oxalatiphilum]